ncbi:MAG: porin [Janthinobacterium lividum]
MKKHLIALSAGLLGLTSLAQAQSSVTLYGVVDAAVTYVNASGKGSKTAMDSSGMNSSRYGLLGNEDLGGGLAAGFTLEGDAYPNDGHLGTTTTDNKTPGTTALFGRRAFINLTSQTLGEVRLGRDYTSTYWNLSGFDPFTHLGLGSATTFELTYAGTTTTAVRTSNSVFYLTPNTLGGFFAEANYAFGNQPNGAAGGTGHDGDFGGIRIGYEGHGAKVAASASKTTYVLGDVREANVGGTYDFHIIKAYALYQQAQQSGAVSHTQGTVLLGGIIPVGVNAIRFSALHLHEHGNSSMDSTLLAIGFIYNMSKRTQLYTTYAHIDNHKNAAYAESETSGAVSPTPGGNVNGIQIGLSTKF